MVECPLLLKLQQRTIRVDRFARAARGLFLFVKSIGKHPLSLNILSIGLRFYFCDLSGQYPEIHGIIGNKLYDPLLSHDSIIKIFNTTSEIKTKLYAGTEPIWVSAGKAGHKTACYLWPGCDVEISGYKVDFVEPKQKSEDFNGLIDLAVKWFTKDDVSLAMLHFIEPDHTGHTTGPAPESQETLAMIRQMDQLTGYMLEQLGLHNLLDNVNVLITSDHGMTSASLEDRAVSLYDYIDPSDIEIVVPDATEASILPAEGKLEKVYNDIKDKHPRISVYYREEIPQRFHYSGHRRVLPIVALADEGWLITYEVSGHFYGLWAL